MTPIWYIAIDGTRKTVDLGLLEIVIRSSVDLRKDWIGERINYSPESKDFIEFQEGPENPPGLPQSRAVAVTREYVLRTYGVSELQLASSITAAEARMQQQRRG